VNDCKKKIYFSEKNIISVFDGYSKGQVNLFADHLPLNFFYEESDRHRFAEFYSTQYLQSEVNSSLHGFRPQAIVECFKPNTKETL